MLIPALTVSPLGKVTFIILSQGLFSISSIQWTSVSSKSKIKVFFNDESLGGGSLTYLAYISCLGTGGRVLMYCKD